MKKTLPYFILTALVFLVYGNTFLNSFHFDDVPSILQKPWIRGLDKIPEFIFSWTRRPLVILSFNLNYAISEFRVWSYHLVNMLAHIAVTFLVFQMARLTGKSLSQARTFSFHRNMPFLAALIFALHPLNTQSVTYISSRSSIFATFFYLLALILLFRGLQARHLLPEPQGTTSNVPASAGAFHFAGSVVALAFGGLSKEIIITWPAMAFIFHVYFFSRVTLRRWLSDNLKWILPAIVLLLVSLGIQLFSEETFLLLAPIAKKYSPSGYFLTQSYVIPFEYFWKMFFPFNLSIDIDFPYIADWTQLANYGGIVVLMAFAVIFLTCRDPWIGYAMAWTLITVLPTSSFVPLLDLAVEHRTYLPLVGFSIFFATLFCQVLDYFRSALETNPRFSKPACYTIPAGIILILVFLAAVTVKRNMVWKNEVTLWSDARSKAPRLLRPYNNVGEAYDKLHLYDDAISQFKIALRLNPNYVFALSNLGNIYGKLRNYGKATEYFRRALEVRSEYAPANYNLAKALHVAGKPEEALHYYREAVKLNAYFEEAIFNQAHLEAQLGLFQDSIKTYHRFIEMNPNNAKAHFGLADAYSKSRQYDQAVSAYQKTIRLNPAHLFPQINLATTYMQMGKIEDARSTYEKILGLQPNLAGVHKNLGLIYAGHKNNPAKAIYHFQKSLELDEKQPQAGAIRNTLDELRGKVQKKLND